MHTQRETYGGEIRVATFTSYALNFCKSIGAGRGSNVRIT